MKENCFVFSNVKGQLHFFHLPLNSKRFILQSDLACQLNHKPYQVKMILDLLYKLKSVYIILDVYKLFH